MANTRKLALTLIALTTVTVLLSVLGIAIPVGVVVYVRTYVAEPFQIPSNGMYPSLPSGETLWIDKRACQQLDDIRRGDVVVFEDVWSDGKTYNFIWRVIGLPGEHVVVDGHLVSLDGIQVPHAKEAVVGDHHIAEEGGAGAAWSIAWPVADRARSHQVTDDLVVPAGHIYVLGDNRYDALDGRTAGPVPLDSILGCAFR